MTTSDLIKTDCLSQRKAIQLIRPILNYQDISFLTLCLKKYQIDNAIPDSIKVTVDFRLKSTPQNEFNKLMFDLSNRGRDFSRIIEDRFIDWNQDASYGQCLQFYLDCKNNGYTAWIGKGRDRKSTAVKKSPLIDFCCMCVYSIDDELHGKLFLEDAQIEFDFTYYKNKYFIAKSTPIKNPDHVMKTIKSWT